MYGKKKPYCNWNKMMSIRCKVCNASKITNTVQTNSDINWECQNCGNILDVNGHIIISN